MESFMYITEENVIFIEMSSIFSCDAAFDLALQQGTLENTSMVSLVFLVNLNLLNHEYMHIALFLADVEFEIDALGTGY